MKDLIIEIEEKAKRYDEAIERANSLINCNQLGDVWVYRLLPELQEDSDERIMKDIIAYIRYERKSTEEEIESRFIPWLKKQGEQKPAWSDVDETKLRTAQTFIRNTSLIEVDGIKEATIDWLKSIKDRMTWKPTEEQMEAVRIAAEIGTANNSWAMGVLKSMYQDLTKLKE